MTPERWQVIKGIFDQAMEHADAERTAFLESASSGDPELRREVESLLAAHEDAGSRYDAPIVAGDPMIGRQMGAYRILRRLGAGGMGAVYLAARADDQFRRLVAIKAIRAELLDANTTRRFENERHTLAALEHPNIVRLLDGGATADGIPFLVMDYVEGQPIDRYCRDRNLTIAERLSLFRQLCGAVHYAHQNLVVHRDLKPANILVTPQGVPKLLDFGIAKLLRPEYAAGAVGYTRTAAQPMTPEYASPEQILGQPVTTSSDVYALGVLLYTLLTGSHPFQRQTSSSYELERAICETEAGKPSDAAPPEQGRQLRGDLDTIVLTAMRKEPQRRYASAEHLSEDVRRFIAGEPVAARGESLAYRAGKFIRRHRMALGATVVAVTLLVSLGVSAELGRRRANRLFVQLRGLANFVFDDLDPKMEQSPTDARRAVSERAVIYLDALAQEAKGDQSLQLEAANGYSRIAEIQGNLFKANLGSPEAALVNAQKALDLAQSVWSSDPSNARARELLARSHQTVGSVLQARGDRTGVIEHYQKAIDLASHDKVATANLWTKIAYAQASAGDPQAAAESYRKVEALFSEALAAKPGDRQLTRLLAAGKEGFALHSMNAGESIENAERASQAAIALYEQSPLPRSPGVRRRILMAYKGLADVQRHAGKFAEARTNIYRSLEESQSLARLDPKDILPVKDISQHYVSLIEILRAAGAPEERLETRRAIEWLKPLVAGDQPDPYLLQNYVILLVKTPFTDLKKPQETLALALKAVAQDPNSETFDLLARAYDRVGKLPEAIDAERQALARLPPRVPGRPVPLNRQELEKMLSALEAKGAERNSKSEKAAR